MAEVVYLVRPEVPRGYYVRVVMTKGGAIGYVLVPYVR